MHTARPVKLIKNAERREPEIKAEIEVGSDPNGWSRSVRLWVTEFQERDRGDSLPAFDSLFKETLVE